jgi:rod shape-determining protein MreC
MNLYTKKRSSVNRKSIGLFVFLALFIGGLYLFQSSIKNTFYLVTSPISGRFWQAGVSGSGFLQSFFHTGGLLQENENLKTENQNLLSKISLLHETIEQEDLVKQLAENTQNRNFKTVLAQTIGLSQDSVLLNKGSDDGISENMPVISAERVLYGRVEKVYKNFSSVLLISNTNSVVDSKIEHFDAENPAILGVIKGEGNLSVYLDLVSSDADLKEGDAIITSGQEGVFPRDLLIGKVISSTKNDAKPFQTAKVQPMFDIHRTDTLFVITNYKKEK